MRHPHLLLLRLLWPSSLLPPHIRHSPFANPSRCPAANSNVTLQFMCCLTRHPPFPCSPPLTSHFFACLQSTRS
jgi:hypothetical protein